jgi:predicted O-methyltransferase YrrM
MKAEDIYSHFDIPDHRRKTSLSPKEGIFIYNFLKEKNLSKTIETGLAYGVSASYIIAATEKQHIAIDPYQQEGYKNLGLDNVQKLDLAQHLQFENDLSHNVLPRLLKENKQFDFALMDGAHKFDQIFVDFYYLDLLLEKRGYIFIHDTWMRSTATLLSWIKNNKKSYYFHKSPLQSFAIIQKVGPDIRAWHHFKSFKTWSKFSLLEQFWFEHFNKQYHDSQK